MAAFSSIITAIGVGASVVGTVAGVVGQMQANSAAKRAERLRKQQMNLDAARQRRDIARRAVQARAEAVASATAQGAQYGSGLAGGTAQVASSANQGLLGVNQNTEIGAGIFDANYKQYQGQTLSSIGQGIAGLGQTAMQNFDLFNRVGTYVSSRT